MTTKLFSRWKRLSFNYFENLANMTANLSKLSNFKIWSFYCIWLSAPGKSCTKNMTQLYAILWVNLVYDLVYCIRLSAYTNVRLYECPLIRMSAYTNVCLYECLLIGMSAYSNVRLYECLLIRMSTYMNDRLYKCLLIWISAYKYVHLYEWPLIQMYAYTKVRLYECLFIQLSTSP